MGQKRGGIEFFSTNAKCVQYKSRLNQKKKEKKSDSKEDHLITFSHYSQIIIFPF